MIDEQKREAIFTLHKEGTKVRKISHLLNVDRKTVRKIINENKTTIPIPKARQNKVELNEELLRLTYTRCQNWAERTREVLEKECGIKIAYSTLTARIRELGLKNQKKERAEHVPDVPGEEFQHDTSPYILKIGDKFTKVQGSLIYYRYSKRRYLKFYRSFNRFAMKCFFYEVLNYFGCVPSNCIIDNTNLAVHYGTGKNAVMVQEMEVFANLFKFNWIAHEVGHSDRKGGVESGFRYVEVNFIPGRSFSSLEDLNRQAFKWCEDISNKPTTRAKIIPSHAFEYEIPYMKKIISGMPAPYRQHQRTIDEYGYVAFGGNYYWVPKEVVGAVIVLEFAEKIVLYNRRKKVAEYLAALDLVRNKRFIPDGITITRKPRNRKFASQEEEKQLRSIDPHIGEFIDIAIKGQKLHRGKHQFVKGIWALYKKVSLPIFKMAISRAMIFRVYDLHTLNNICSIIIRNDSYVLPETEVTYDFECRDNYIEGAFSNEPDIKKYEITSSEKINE